MYIDGVYGVVYTCILIVYIGATYMYAMYMYIDGVYGCSTGGDPGFQARGGALKKIAPSEGGAKIFGVFRVKNHDYMPKNHIFSNFRGGAPALYMYIDCVYGCLFLCMYIDGVYGCYLHVY